MRLTRRGVTLLGGAACCYAIGALAGYPLFRMLGTAATGFILAAMVSTIFRPHLEVSRSVHPDRIERGDPALASLVLRAKNQWYGDVAMADRVGDQVRNLQIRLSASGMDAAYHYELPTSLRGRLQVGPFTMTHIDVFGLVRVHQIVGDTTALWVHPRRHYVRPALVVLSQHPYHGSINHPRLHGPADLRAVREYAFGDEVRNVHWKATARTGKLMVREYSDPTHVSITVLLDNRRTAMSPTVFEEAVEVAASLLHASATARQRSRLLTASGIDVVLNGNAHAARALLDELCLVLQDAANAISLTPLSLAMRPPDGALIMITGPDADLGTASRWRPNKVIRLGVPQSANYCEPGVIAAVTAADAVTAWNASRPRLT